jgi:tetratricopeptide (TPR) repeat protein
MAQINLRDYLHGLEELIDGGHGEDALAHCRHILQTFPKHIETYRTMGKAYLELKRHSEASDIFQRVLSSVPDDFVSHIGMSIIREDEGNQDAAIWHMERAFESQPSNRAVQDELRRLYGKREGYEPPKVRLTRGALARMYAHGDLYNQAIGELRGALSEDAQRPDLQVLLAEMYFKTKRQADAIDVCSKLIEKLPYCLYANQVMVDILRAGQRDVEAQPYWERVEELDPYAAQTSAATPPEEVPAESVMLEQLVLGSASSAAVGVPKAWTASLKLPEDNKFEKENLPDWLSLDNLEEKLPASGKVPEQLKSEPSVLNSLEDLEPVSSPAKETTPAAPPSATQEKPVTQTPFTSVSRSTALQADNIPDWLRELRPATGSISLDQPKPAAEPIETTHAAEPPAATSATAESVPAWEPAPQSTTKIPTPPLSEEDEENLSWLEGLAAKQGATEDELLTAPEKRDEAAPGWLEKDLLAAKPKSDSLAWLDELDKENPIDPAGPAPTEAKMETPLADEQAQSEPEAVRAKSDTTPMWLKDLSAEVEQQAARAAEPIAPRPLEEAPDWLSELRPDAAAPEDEAEENEEEEWQGGDDLSKLDWLEELGPAKTQGMPLKTGEPLKTSEPAKANVSAWIPEAELAGATPVESSPVAAPAVAAAARMSPRKTAQLMTAQLAPGKLEMARQALNYGKLKDAADHYGYLLRRRVMLDEIIADLNAAMRRFPQDVTLWQTLGDAYMRNNQLREALDCYTKAEDLL